MSKLTVYHGSSTEVREPSLKYGRADADFGIGFYVTTNLQMAEKWACRKKKSVVNEYVLDTGRLNEYRFPLDKEWLDFVIQNRSGYTPFAYDNDMLIGATADDRLFATIEQYEEGFIDAETAVDVLNCIKIGEQICLRTESALKNLTFVKSIILEPEYVKKVQETNRADRELSNRISGEIIRSRNSSRKQTSILSDRIARKQEIVNKREALRCEGKEERPAARSQKPTL